MDLKPCKYSVIKYVPDESIGEVFNVGVILHCISPFFFKTYVDTNRVKKVYKDVDLYDLKFTLDYIRSMTEEALPLIENTHLNVRYGDPSFLQRLSELFQDNVAITEPMTTLVEEPGKELRRLLTKYVQSSMPSKSKQRLHSQVMNRFKDAGIEKKIQTQIPVEVGVVDKVQFGYVNGRPNLVQPIPLTATMQTNMEKAAFWNIAVHQIREKSTLYKESPFYAIVKPSINPQRDGFESAVDLLTQNFPKKERDLIKIVNFDTLDMDRLIEKIKQEAH